MGVVNYTELANTSTPFIYVADLLFGDWGRWAGIIATIMASLSAFSVTLGASSRVLFALGRDGHFPRSLRDFIPNLKPHILRYSFVQPWLPCLGHPVWFGCLHQPVVLAI